MNFFGGPVHRRFGIIKVANNNFYIARIKKRKNSTTKKHKLKIMYLPIYLVGFSISTFWKAITILNKIKILFN